MKELTDIQSELQVGKNRYNAFGKYSYRSVEDIYDAVKPLLHKHSLALIVSDDIVEVGGKIYVKATATITNKEGAQVIVSAYAREADHKKGMDDAQLTGSCSSYARKYALGGLFLLDDNQGVDSLDNTKEFTTKKKNNVKKEEQDEPAEDWQVRNLAKLYKQLGEDPPGGLANYSKSQAKSLYFDASKRLKEKKQ